MVVSYLNSVYLFQVSDLFEAMLLFSIVSYGDVFFGTCYNRSSGLANIFLICKLSYTRLFRSWLTFTDREYFGRQLPSFKTVATMIVFCLLLTNRLSILRCAILQFESPWHRNRSRFVREKKNAMNRCFSMKQPRRAKNFVVGFRQKSVSNVNSF